VQIRIGRALYDTLVEEFVDADYSLPDLRAAIAEEMASAGMAAVRADVRKDLLKRVMAMTRRAQMHKVLAAWYQEHDWLMVRDTGHGMSRADLAQIYLTIGTRSRHQERMALAPNSGARAPLGEKGVGRLSTMRLGDVLEVVTSRKGEARENILDVDWGLFSHDSDAMLNQIRVTPRAGARKDDRQTQGTQVIIRHLKDVWTVKKLETLAADEFSKLVDPFESAAANRILYLSFNGARVYLDEIDQRYLDVAHGRCTATYSVARGRPELTGSVHYMLRGKSRNFKLDAVDLMSVTGIKSAKLLRALGKFEMEMWWFNRRLFVAVPDLGSRSEISKEIAKWSGGLMLFRDGYRVNPYGSGGDDWLELDKRAFASRGFKLNRQQVVGRAKISWRNRGLIDQTNREGLSDTPEKRLLVKVLQYIIFTEFKVFLDNEDKAARIQERTTFENIEEKVRSTEDEIMARLKDIDAIIPAGERHLTKQTRDLVRELSRYMVEAKALSDEVANDRQQLVHLAGIGLMVEFIMHELERTTSSTLSTLRDIDSAVLNRPTQSSLMILSDQLKTLHKRVANLDPISSSRRQVKEKFDIFQTIRQVVEGRQGQIARHGFIIDGSFRDDANWSVRAVRGMFIQIIENLLSNSFYWSKFQSEIERGLEPRITIDVDPVDSLIIITDNGPGVAPEIASEIFQPFVTRRPAGEGHGLGLYISREIAHYHGWTLDIERTSNTREGRYNTFILDMSGQ
jgi:signal transduction histidine kinase